MEKNLMPLVKVGSKHQVVIPKNVRDQLGVKPGDYVEMTYKKNQAVLKRKKIVDDFPITDEPIGPKSRAGIRQGLKEMRQGKVGPRLKTKKELQEYLDDLKR